MAGAGRVVGQTLRMGGAGGTDRRAWMAAVLVALLAAMALAACGGGGGDGGEDEADDTEPGAEQGEASDPSVPALEDSVLEFRPVLEVLPPETTPCEAPGEEACYVLGPETVDEEAVESAEAGRDQALEAWTVNLVLTEAGIDAFNTLAASCFATTSVCPTQTVAIVLDGAVISAPQIQVPEFERDAITVSGTLDQAQAEELALALSA